MRKSGKEHKTLLIILVLFIAFVFNSAVVFAKPTDKEKATALEDFRYYYLYITGSWLCNCTFGVLFDS